MCSPGDIAVQSFLGPLLVLALLHPLPAQTSSKTEVLPASMENSEGLGGTPYPFGVSKPCRYQTLYESVKERGPTRIITELRLRGDWVNATYTQKAKAWANMAIAMSHSDRGFSTVSSTFSWNRGLDQTGVFKIKKVAFPPQGASKTGPRPFNISLPLDRPFIHRPTAGNLLVEYIILDQPAGDYRLDSGLHCLSPSAGFGKRDASCYWTRKTSTGTEKAYLRLSSNVSIKLGNQVDWTLEDAPPNTPALFMIGNDPKYARWGAFSVPIPLMAFGATGCYLNTDLMLSTVAVSNASGTAVASFKIPGNYAYLGQYLHSQALAPQYAANRMGLVFSLGHKAKICGPVTATRIMAIGDLKTERGSILYGDAPIIQLVYQ